MFSGVDHFKRKQACSFMLLQITFFCLVSVISHFVSILSFLIILGNLQKLRIRETCKNFVKCGKFGRPVETWQTLKNLFKPGKS